MAYDEKDAVCLFLLRDWNKFVERYKEKLNNIYYGEVDKHEKIKAKAEFKALNYIDKVIKEEFLC